MEAPDGNVHGANMGPIWGRQDPGGPHVGPMNFAIWGIVCIGVPLWDKLPVTGGFSSERVSDAGFDVFFIVNIIKLLNKHSIWQ